MSTGSPLEERFEAYLTSHDLVRRESSILLAVSGGIDSMVMLSLFSTLRKSWKLSVGVIHVNHLLRGEESEADEEFVRNTSSALGLPFHVKRIDTAEQARVHRSSLQEIAREIRYSFFEETRKSTGANAVATAHQANDNAETVLMNAVRGAGVRGLSGIPVRRDPAIIRPLLFAYRDEIETYAADHGIPYREDSSNASLKYVRNIIRNRIIPELQAHSNVVESLNRVSAIMGSLGARIGREIQTKEKELLTFDPTGLPRIVLSLFQREPLYLQEELILHVLRMLEIGLSAEKVFSIIELCSQQTGRSLRLSAECSVYRDRNMLVFERPPIGDGFAIPVQIGGKYEVGDFRFSLEREPHVPKKLRKTEYSEFIDAKSLGTRLVLRSWKAGDRFVPLGMKAAKKLSDFFTDEKVPLVEKSRTPILESDGTIVWVCGRRLDDRFKVTPATRKAIKLTFRPLQAQ